MTFSTLFPNVVTPNHGIFTETSLRQQLREGTSQSVVIAPVPWFPSTANVFGRFARFAPIPREEFRSGVRVLHPRYFTLPRLGMHFAPLSMACAARAAAAGLIAEGYDFDVIDAHYFYPDGVAATLLGAWLGKPVVINALGSDVNLLPHFALPRRLIRWAGSRTAHMVCVCDALRVELVRLGLPAERIWVLRNGVDLDMFYPEPRAAVRALLGIEGYTLLSVGNLVNNKGHDKVICALAELPEVSLIVVGGGPAHASLMKLARDTGVASRVRFTGVLTQPELRSYYSGADALILASSREGWANVLLEAMACGTPALASPVGGTPEVISSPEAGHLLGENSAAGVAAAVRALRAAPPNRASTRAFAEKYSWRETSLAKLSLFARISGYPTDLEEPCLPTTSCST